MLVSSPFFPSRPTRRSSRALWSVAASTRSRALDLSCWSSPTTPCFISGFTSERATKRERRSTYASSGLGAALGDRDQLAEGLCVTNRQVGEHLAVDVDARQLQPVHELVVGHALAARGSVDPGDPELAHVPRAGRTVAIGVLERVEHGLVRRPEQRPVRHTEALGQVEDLLVTLARRNASLYEGHLSLFP